MAYSGRITLDALVHDKSTDSMKVIDVESSKPVSTKTAIVQGSLSGSLVVSPDDADEVGYRDSSGSLVSFSTIEMLVVKGDEALEVSVNSSVTFASLAGQCAISATPGVTNEDITVTGSGAFQLIIVGT